MDVSRRQTLAYLGTLLAVGVLPRPAAAAGPAKAAAPADKPKGGPVATKRKPADVIWEDLLEGNRRFIAGKPQERALIPTRQELAKGQAPKVIVLGCSDSRVVPTIVFDKSLGDLFVIRTAGNVADPIALGSIEYAAEHLHSAVLVVLGHEKCGAVAAAAAGGKVESRNLKAIVSRINPALKPLRETVKGDELVRLGVEANVQMVAQTVLAKSKVLAGLVQEEKLTVFKAVYRLDSGEVARLL
jgi:carbonic anhydrase